MRRSPPWTATGSAPPRSSAARDLSDALGFDGDGGVWVKDETGNVSGSHKGRHLMGVLIHLAVMERCGLTRPRPPPGPGHRQLR